MARVNGWGVDGPSADGLVHQVHQGLHYCIALDTSGASRPAPLHAVTAPQRTVVKTHRGPPPVAA